MKDNQEAEQSFQTLNRKGNSRSLSVIVGTSACLPADRDHKQRLYYKWNTCNCLFLSCDGESYQLQS